MRRPPIRITTPYPSLEDTAALTKMSPERVKEILELADKLMADRKKREENKHKADDRPRRTRNARQQ